MNEKKYELTGDFIEILGRKLYRIRALRDFSNIKTGDLGGYIENENNLSHDGDAWVYDNAKVYGDALVGCDASIYGYAKVYGDADIKSDLDYATISGFGPHRRTTTFFRCKDGFIRVTCEFFYGTINEFREKVKEIHGDNKYKKEYLMFADLMEMHFAEN